MTQQKNQIKIAIVGADERKWLNQLQITLAKEAIMNILSIPLNYKTLVTHASKKQYGADTVGINIKIDDAHLLPPNAEIILVSGHCPYGGVDVWAEEAAKKLNIKTEIHKPEHNGWGNDWKCPDCNQIFTKPSDVTKHGKIAHNKNAYQLTPTKIKGYMERNLEIAQSCTILYDIEPVIGHGDHFTPQIYQDLLAKYNHYGKPKFELELTTKLEQPDMLGNKIDAISGVPTHIETDPNRTWLCYDGGYAREIGKTINKWTAVYTSGGYWTLQKALQLKKHGSRMVPIA